MKVSVVTPVFNEEAVLKDFFSRVTAVFDQIDKSIELEMIFVNDGSEDNSQSIIQEFCVMDRRTKLITLSRNFRIIFIAKFSHFLFFAKNAKFSRNS